MKFFRARSQTFWNVIREHGVIADVVLVEYCTDELGFSE